MHRLTKLLFAVADILAWMILAFSIAAALAFPFVGPVSARMSGQPLTVFGIAGTCALWLAVAGGAYAITRRQVFGVGLVLLPVAQLMSSGRVGFGLAVAGALVLAFATPFILVLLQARPGTSRHVA